MNWAEQTKATYTVRKKRHDKMVGLLGAGTYWLIWGGWHTNDLDLVLCPMKSGGKKYHWEEMFCHDRFELHARPPAHTRWKKKINMLQIDSLLPAKTKIRKSANNFPQHLLPFSCFPLSLPPPTHPPIINS
jgi:hypothetical protein